MELDGALPATQPESLGHYHIIRPLGAGGMGEVYLARDSRLEREVAVKTLPQTLAAEATRLARFEREAKAAAALNHPNIVTIYAIEDVDGQRFITMELVDGRTLREHVMPPGLPLEELYSLGIHLADALYAAHRCGVIHRDLKPANVMMSWDGRVKVLDFGLAALRRAVDDRDANETTLTLDEHVATRTGEIMGTPGFMAPEQLQGAPVDSRADLFALGAVLYFAATGTAPFTAASIPETVARALRDDPPTPSRLRAELPAELDRLVLRLLAKDPDRRIQTALDVRNELEDLRRGTRPSQAEARPKTVAVLPFTDMSPELDQEHLCHGVAEELIGSLSRIEDLKVAARSSAFRYRETDLDLRDIGRQLGVDTVLEGSVRKAGERLRIAVRLVDVVDGYQLWSERFDRGFEDIFAIQDEIAERVAEKLRGMLAERERQALHGTVEADPQAYELYLRGRHSFALLSRANLAAARALFRRSLELDTEFPQAWAGLSLAHAWAYQWWREEEHREPGVEAARKALELAPDLADAHMAMGWAMSHEGDLEAAEGHLRRALELDPDLWEAHWLYGRLCVVTGRHEKAVEHFSRAVELDPDDYQAPCLLMQEAIRLGRHEEALLAARRGVERVRRRLERYPDDARAHCLGTHMLLRIGERERAMEWARRAEALTPGDPSTLYNLACFYAVAGDSERALDTLDRTVSEGFGFPDWIDNDPDFDELRDDPRFQEIRARLDG